jgi:hypothetical protein
MKARSQVQQIGVCIYGQWLEAILESQAES